MDPVVWEILKPLGLGGLVVGLVIWIGRLISQGGWVPRASHDRELKLVQDQVSWITSDRDGYRGAYETERQRMDTLSDQVKLLVEGQQTTVAMLTSIKDAAARNASH